MQRNIRARNFEVNFSNAIHLKIYSPTRATMAMVAAKAEIHWNMSLTWSFSFHSSITFFRKFCVRMWVITPKMKLTIDSWQSKTLPKKTGNGDALCHRKASVNFQDITHKHTVTETIKSISLWVGVNMCEQCVRCWIFGFRLCGCHRAIYSFFLAMHQFLPLLLMWKWGSVHYIFRPRQGAADSKMTVKIIRRI